MNEPSHVRAISLALALSVVISGWLLFEYSNRQSEQIPPLVEKDQKALAPSVKEMPPAPSQAQSPPSSVLPSNVSVTYKCEKAGRVSYSDQPCSGKEKTIAITTAEKEQPTKNNLQQMQERLSALEASRRERDKSHIALTQVSSSASTTNADQAKSIRCQQIDRAIAAKDSELRQPHSAQWGDYLTGERKKLTDERFSISC